LSRAARARRRSLALGAALVLASGTLLAQQSMPFGPGAMTLPGEPSQTQSTQHQGGKKKKGEPQLHAAPTAGEPLMPTGTEPSLPPNPLKMSKSVRARIGTDEFLGDETLGRGATTTRHFYGPYYEEQSGRYRLRLAFPLWFERTQPSLVDPTKPDRASLFGGLLYDRRAPDHADDILFPVFWNLRDPHAGTRTTIVGPFVNRVAPGEHDNWLAPLYFTGKRKHGGYTLIPPLLTYTHTNAEGGFTLVGPMFCSWKGGSHCDTRSASDIDFGVAPLYFYGQNVESKYELIPPLIHYYRYRDRDLSWLDIWGPYYREHTQKRDMLHILPLYWSIWGKNERHTTLLPFFHYGWKDKSWLFINPLFLLARGENGESTFVTWGYARYRGRTDLDMITPLYWHFRDPDIGLDEQLLFPFLYSRTSPRESNQAFFPFWAHFERYGLREQTWITPFFYHSTDLRGWETNINPIFYMGRDARSTHLVIPPVFWDFASPSGRTTIGFPVFWRFADRHSVSQLVGNVYYHERQLRNGLDWQIHIFPVFSYGETPDGHWWNVLYGLAGYTRRGDFTQMRTLWIPITLSGKSN
jgi:hypothetical protein